MIIYGEKLRLHYWETVGHKSGYCNYKEIEKKLYGYKLEPGQTIAEIRYYGSNAVFKFDCYVNNVCDKGLTVTPRWGQEIFLPWVDDLPNAGEKVRCDLYIVPCEHLYRHWPLKDVLAGTVPDQDYEPNGKPIEKGRGIWYQHGGWRKLSKYEGNLKNFVKMGQQNIY